MCYDVFESRNQLFNHLSDDLMHVCSPPLNCSECGQQLIDGDHATYHMLTCDKPTLHSCGDILMFTTIGIIGGLMISSYII
jgi:hypothetical protein